jgi:hypothetical protein
MTPREFLDQIVRPNLADFAQNYGDIRHAFNAIAAVDALTAHIHIWTKANAPTLASQGDDTAYRDELARQNRQFSLLRDVAKAQKHVHLDRGNPQIRNTDKVTARAIGFGEGGYGEGRYGGSLQVVVDLPGGGLAYVETIIAESLNLLEQEMKKVGA